MLFRKNDNTLSMFPTGRKMNHDVIIIEENSRSESRIERLNKVIILLKGERSQMKIEMNSVTKEQLEYEEWLSYVIMREEDIERIQEAIDIVHNIAKSEYLEAVNKLKWTILL